MVIARASCTFFSVPERTAGMLSSLARGGAVRSAPVMSSATTSWPDNASRLTASAAAKVADLVTAASRSGGRRPRHDRRYDLLLAGSELLLELGDRRGGE